MLILSADPKHHALSRRSQWDRQAPLTRQHRGKVFVAGANTANPLPTLHHRVTPGVLAQPLLWSDKRRFHAGHKRPSYTFPTEHFPQRLQHVAHVMDPGTWVGVGTERLWMAAASIPQIEFALGVDSDAAVVLYNQINAALLRHAQNRQAYLGFRMQAGAEAWADLALRANEAADVALLQEPSTRQFWNTQMKHPCMRAFHAMPANPQSPFFGVHYLSQDDLYKRLVKLARGGRVQAAQVDLAQPADLERVADALRTSPHVPRISVLDISNAWAPACLNPRQLFGIVKVWQGVATKASMLVGTHAAWMHDTADYTYFAAHFSALTDPQDKGAFSDWLASVHTQSHDSEGLARPAAIERIDPHLMTRVAGVSTH